MAFGVQTIPVRGRPRHRLGHRRPAETYRATCGGPGCRRDVCVVASNWHRASRWLPPQHQQSAAAGTTRSLRSRSRRPPRPGAVAWTCVERCHRRREGKPCVAGGRKRRPSSGCQRRRHLRQPAAERGGRRAHLRAPTCLGPDGCGGCHVAIGCLMVKMEASARTITGCGYGLLPMWLARRTSSVERVE
jgi:hypothetical protein